MAYLVNPVGWRLYFKFYWKTNYFLKRNTLYFLAVNKSKVLYEVFYAILTYLTLYLNHRKTLISFYTLKILLHSNNMYVLIKTKLYWRSIYFEFSLTHNKHLRPIYDRQVRQNNWNRLKYKKKKLSPAFEKQRQFLLKRINRRFFKLRYSRLFFYNYQQKTLIPNYPRFFESQYFPFYKNLILFFSFYPLFFFFKYYIITLTNILLPKNFRTSIHFFGLNQYTPNPKDLLNLAEYLIIELNYSPIKTLYTLLGILRDYESSQKIKGFKLLLAGRFTKRDRAIYLWKSYNHLKLSSKLSNVLYHYTFLYLIYGKCVVKLWLCV